VNRLGFVLSSRGLRNSFERAAQVASRFGITAARMNRRLQAFADVVEQYGARPSLPITAAVLDRNPQVARRLQERGVELCVHSFVHNDLSGLGASEQARQIGLAIQLFNRHGIRFRGFRSPYLKYNQATLDAVKQAGFAYDSNMPFYWAPAGFLEGLSPDEKDGLRRGLDFYRPAEFPAEQSLPRPVRGLLEIPVSLPDDEILLDRVGMDPARIGDVWLEMARMALERGELFTLQLHPERLTILRDALCRTLDFARSGGDFWIATLSEISDWWKRRSAAELSLKTAGRDLYAVAMTGPGDDDLAIEVIRPGSGQSLLEPGQTLSSSVKPVIGIGPETSQALRQYLSNEGYLFDITEDTQDNSVFIRHDITGPGLLEALAAAAGPVVRMGRWPRPFRAAMAVTGDIDCLTLGDFLRRFRED
jgi:peptidoglycan/xylan/chitin deacetylase (PgdA/CDA1 family)